MRAYAKNPVAEMMVITNPSNMKKQTKKRRNPASRLNDVKKFAVPAAGILGGMVIGSQGAKMIDRFVPASMGMAKKAIAVAAPILVGMALVGASKKDAYKYVAIGMGAAGLASGVRLIAPSLSSFPLAGQLANALAGPSGFVPQLPAPMAPQLPAPVANTGSQLLDLAGPSGFAYDWSEGDDY